MNINTFQSYDVNLLQTEAFFIQGIKQAETLSENVDAGPSTVNMLYEFRLNIQARTVDNIIMQSNYGYPGAWLSPDLSSLFDNKQIKPGQASAADVMAEDGFFSIANTASRIADFVLSAAGDNPEMLKAGREGALRGFKEAEKIWGGRLPDISYQTIERAVDAIDHRIEEMGGSVVSITA